MASGHGRFVLVSAGQAQAPTHPNASYAAAKAASETWTLALADRFKGTGATANIVVVEAIVTLDARGEPRRGLLHLHARGGDRRGDRLPLLGCRLVDERPAPDATWRRLEVSPLETSNAGSETSATRVRRAFTRRSRHARRSARSCSGRGRAGDGEPEVRLGRSEHEAHPEYGELCREAEVREDRDGEVVVRRTSPIRRAAMRRTPRSSGRARHRICARARSQTAPVGRGRDTGVRCVTR